MVKPFLEYEVLTVPKKMIGLGLLFRIFGDVKWFALLIKDLCLGKYRKIPCRSIVAILFTILYILFPIDFLPDYILGIGQVDDAMILILCLFFIERDLAQYKEWKRQR
jgi:uncharacterized membrane protein YkvA (DUF1232 family)